MEPHWAIVTYHYRLHSKDIAYLSQARALVALPGLTGKGFSSISFVNGSSAFLTLAFPVF
jgi:hypothetical protein